VDDLLQEKKIAPQAGQFSIFKLQTTISGKKNAKKFFFSKIVFSSFKNGAGHVNL
jgi:hypothetical protein